MVYKLLEFFGLQEAIPTDDKGRPLRTQDPFAPPPKAAPPPVAPQGSGRNTKDQSRTPPSPNAVLPPPDSRKIPTYAKPQYRGTFVGQTWTTNDKTVNKNVAWQNKVTGEPGYGKVQSMQKVTLVWDGQDWIPQQEFNYKAKSGQLRGK